MITLVCGPPCSGKSVYVKRRAKPSHLIVDHDALAQGFGSPRTHGHKQQYRDAAEREVAEMFNEIASGMHRHAWVIRTMPRGHQRRDLARRLRADRVVVLTEPREVLVARALERSNPRHTISLIDRWLQTYTPEPSALGIFD